ncbi:hypothetical protein AYK24_00075 [Thermoplasmatales archaeon SG8-52-4]|nr:MAG: hypothetical protein AYK24_00075 [Thermoplasmatales archaeon SG8-52-4]
MTKEEFDQLPSDSKETCPECGLRGYTTPYPNCGCPRVKNKAGFEFISHINKWHHNCEEARKRANKNG